MSDSISEGKYIEKLTREISCYGKYLKGQNEAERDCATCPVDFECKNRTGICRMKHEQETVNGVIQSVDISCSNTGFITSFLNIEAEDGCQSFGGYRLDKDNSLAIWITGIMKALEITDWYKVTKQPCRIVRKNGLISSIGHHYKDLWFYADELKGGKHK